MLYRRQQRTVVKKENSVQRGNFASDFRDLINAGFALRRRQPPFVIEPNFHAALAALVS
jgi:hypothetical protein